jgi:hypothetical protein
MPCNRDVAPLAGGMLKVGCDAHIALEHRFYFRFGETMAAAFRPVAIVPLKSRKLHSQWM